MSTGHQWVPVLAHAPPSLANDQPEHVDVCTFACVTNAPESEPEPEPAHRSLSGSSPRSPRVYPPRSLTARRFSSISSYLISLSGGGAGRTQISPDCAPIFPAGAPGVGESREPRDPNDSSSTRGSKGAKKRERHRAVNRNDVAQ